ncbi:MAG: M16 family metallopeptidase [Planctomycetota bacterium]|jgi:predicted Zn-dependent peptidase
MIERRTLTCGATLLIEPMDNVASASMSWLLPLGAASDPGPHDGHAVMLSELIFRGAGSMSSRDHSNARDAIGVQRSSSVANHHMRLAATCLGANLLEAMDLVAPMVVDPLLPDEALEPVRSLCLQSLQSLDDDPQHRVMLELKRRHEPPPFNRSSYGTRELVVSVTADDLRSRWHLGARPIGSIISVAGAVEADPLEDRLNALLAGWSGEPVEPGAPGATDRGRHHLDQDTSQVHIAAAASAPAEPHPDSMLERMGIAVLSGGSSARLFTEVRQKRSLCYSVAASYRAGRDRGSVALYAGTTPERAAETIEVSTAEYARLGDGVTSEELQRAAIGLKSHLIMQGESTAARAAAIGHDEFRLGAPRTLDDIARAVDAIELDALNAYLARRSPDIETLVSIGPVFDAVRG